MPIRIFVADDQPLIVAGLRAVTAKTNIEIVGHGDGCGGLVAQLLRLKPDVLVTEFRLGANDVIKTLEAYVEKKTACRIVFFSSIDYTGFLARASTIGGYDFVSKKESAEVLLKTIESAAAGQPTPADSPIKKARAKAINADDWDDAQVELTPRERQVLQHLALGMSNREIGRSLSLGSSTVKEYVQKIMRKLDANDRTQAAVWAVREGII